MTPWLFLALALAGGIGASVRYVADGIIRSKVPAGYPWPTTLINVSGSMVLGFLTGLAMDSLLPADLMIVLGTGFLGGYTTFSTASYETVQLVRDRRYAAALGNGLGLAVAAVAAALLGLWLGISL
ncbi:fluoride efflux transporter CrcB [Paeniglutamicibacter kerguelensis]|uniref:Fluoride-specific ion channel FluC n=1 Tax=Paeniglutamicibacter kerguelensis TaxID=254788 RepID=A0ABS4XBR2_9MICC|nr:fluoride efflux transporter CrcB [Paeniglutamicibacter kerguelensis]MBP2385910.1 CrcB protein [Paeniglutamicibacter kerguelensis]